MRLLGLIPNLVSMGIVHVATILSLAGRGILRRTSTAHKKILPRKFTTDDRAGTVSGRMGARSKIRMSESTISRLELRLYSRISGQDDSRGLLSVPIRG